MPPPLPTPTPGPWPAPTPPPDPEPMPPPDPVPFEGGAAGSTAAIVPRLGMWLSAMCTCGGTTTVGSAVSRGFSLRTTIWGGVICSIASFGNLPLGATTAAAHYLLTYHSCSVSYA